MAGVFQRCQLPSLALGVFGGQHGAEPGAQLLAGSPARALMGHLQQHFLWLSLSSRLEPHCCQKTL